MRLDAANPTDGTTVPGLPPGAEFHMWVVPVQIFLLLEGPPLCHQEMMRRGLLVKWQRGMRTTFVTHQWLGTAHPDADGQQLDVLRNALKRLAAGAVETSTCLFTETVLGAKFSLTSEVRETLLHGFIWYDYYSIPQITVREASAEVSESDTLRAVRSIPAYVQVSDVFAVLCPSLPHQISGELCDFRSWRTRGWCRVEQIAHVLSSLREDPPPIILIKSPTRIRYALVCLNALMDPVGHGDFTVQEDRAKLFPVVEGLVDNKLRQLQGREDSDKSWINFHILKSLKGRLLEGLPRPGVPRGLSDLATELASASHCPKGFGPLCCAATVGDPQMIQQVVEAGAPVGQGLTGGLPILALSKGYTPLMFASLWSTPDAVTAILNSRADPGQRAGSIGWTAFLVAATRSAQDAAAVPVLQALLEARADLRDRNATGATALHLAASSGSRPIAEFLLSRGAKVDALDRLGCTPLGSACLCSGSHEVALTLLRNRANPNITFRPQGPAALALVAAARAKCAVGQVSLALRAVVEAPGATALHLAAMEGHGDLCSTLLEARTDPGVRNSRGHTARHLAEVNAHSTLLALLDGTGLRGGGGGPTVSVASSRASSAAPGQPARSATLCLAPATPESVELGCDAEDEVVDSDDLFLALQESTRLERQISGSRIRATHGVVRGLR